MHEHFAHDVANVIWRTVSEQIPSGVRFSDGASLQPELLDRPREGTSERCDVI